MNIQRFANVYDEMIADYNKSKTKTEKEIKNLATEKQNAINTYEQNYQNQLSDYQNLMDQQQQNINTWAETQRETQQKQTDYEVGLINQNKKEAEEQTNAELGNAYIDYQKGLNQFGGSAEQLAAQGLSGTGFAKNQEIAMNITYQNRMSSAKSALQKANTQYDNQIQQALINNDAKLAEIALQEMQQSYALALQGFEYRTTMENNRQTYLQNLNDSYFSKTNTLQSRLDNYTSSINSIKATKYAEEQAAATRYSSGGGSYRSSGGSGGSKTGDTVGGFSDTTSKAATNTTYYNQYTGKQMSYNKDAMTNGKVDKNKVFSNGYQPNNITVNGKNYKVSKTGQTVAEVFGKGGITGKNKQSLDNQNIWKAGGKYYVWDGSRNSYIDVTNLYNNRTVYGKSVLGSITQNIGKTAATEHAKAIIQGIK